MHILSNRQFLFISSTILLLSCITAIVFDNNLFFLAAFLPLLLEHAITKTALFFWLMVAALPLSTELLITPTLGLDFPDEPLLITLTVAFLFKLAYRPAILSKPITTQPLFLLLVLHLIWIAVSCIYSTNSIISLKYLAAKIWYIIPFVIIPFTILINERSIKQFALLLLLPMLFTALQCIIRHSFYSFSFEGIKKTLSPFFRNHVNYSAMLVCIMPIGWSIIKLTAKAKPAYKLSWMAMFVMLAALILSYSRGAWVALVIGIAGGVIVYYNKIKTAVTVFLVILIVATGWLFYNNNYLKFAPDYNKTIFHTNLSQHLEATITLKDVSNAERFYRWVAAFNMIKANPIAGVGPNGFYDNYKNYTESTFKTWVSNNKDHSSVHNYFLLTALEQGLVGMLLFIVLVIAMLIKLQRLYYTLQNVFYKQVALATAVIVIIIITVNFLNDLIETDKIGSLFWLCLGMIFILNEQCAKEEINTVKQ